MAHLSANCAASAGPGMSRSSLRLRVIGTRSSVPPARRSITVQPAEDPADPVNQAARVAPPPAPLVRVCAVDADNTAQFVTHALRASPRGAHELLACRAASRAGHVLGPSGMTRLFASPCRLGQPAPASRSISASTALRVASGQNAARAPARARSASSPGPSPNWWWHSKYSLLRSVWNMPGSSVASVTGTPAASSPWCAKSPIRNFPIVSG